MWPKLLLDMLPHFSRLVPLADKYFSGRGDQDKEHTAALTALGEEVRGGRVHVDEVHAGLRQALKQQGEQIAEIGVEATRARMAVETVELRVAKLEQSQARALRVTAAALMLLLGAVVMLIIVLVKLKAR